MYTWFLRERKTEGSSCSLRLEQPSNVTVVDLVPSGAAGLGLGRVPEEILLLLVDEVLAGVEVHIGRWDAAALGPEHVAEQEDDVQGNTEVARDEGGVVKGLTAEDEDAVVLGEGDDAAEEEGDVAAPDAEGCLVGHDAVGDVLRLAALAEVDVGDEDGDPGQQAEDGSLKSC